MKKLNYPTELSEQKYGRKTKRLNYPTELSEQKHGWKAKMIKTFHCLAVICCLAAICFCAEVFGLAPNDPPALISILRPDDLHIINQTDNSICGSFHVSLFSNPKKCTDGSLQFSLIIDRENFNGKIRFCNETIKDSENGKVFHVIIPKNELKNKIFFKEIQLETDVANFKPDKIKLKIEPKVEIFADCKSVSFGKISHNGICLSSENSPSVAIRYSVLKDAVCEVSSKNNFHLKNRDNYIPYSMNGLTENGEINLPSDQDEYIAAFRILCHDKKPVAGIYSDKITFSIKTQL